MPVFFVATWLAALIRRQKLLKSRDLKDTDLDRRNAREDTTESPETRVLELRPPNVRLEAYSDRLERLSFSELSIWIGFLSIYGKKGVLLRELIMMVTALEFLAGELSSFPRFSGDGKRISSISPDSDLFLLKLLKYASGPRELEAIERKFVSRRLITVSGASLSGSSIHQDWVTDTRSWSVNQDTKDTNGDKINYATVCQYLLRLYTHFPDRDGHPIAERYREILYYHGRAAVSYISRLLQDKKVVLDEMQGVFLPVALKILSYRFQQGDEEMIELATGRKRSGVPHWPLLSAEYLLLRLIKLHSAVSRNDIESADLAIQPLLQISVDGLARRITDGRTWGLVGYIFTESMDAAEKMRDRKSFNKCAQLARDWCDVALKSRRQMEMAALCCVHVRLKAFDDLDTISQESHLTCGYYLARAGVLRHAVYFLSSGIAYCEQNLPKLPIWRYHIELWSVRMRLGQWKVAEKWLSATWERLATRDNYLPAGGFDLWKQSGDLGEFKLLLASLLSDCYVASSRFVEAEKIALIALEGTLLMRDTFIRSTRIALKSRLLNIRIELQVWHNAAETAIDLCDEIQERENLPFDSLTISWIIQEILACVDELVHEASPGTTGEAYHVLQRLKSRFMIRKFHHANQTIEQGSNEGHGILLENNTVSTDRLLDDLSADIDKRCGEVGSMLTYREVAASDRILPSSRSIQSQRLNTGVQIQIPDLAPHEPNSEHNMEDLGYHFPAARSMNEVGARRKSLSITDSLPITDESQEPETRVPKRTRRENKITQTQTEKPVGLKLRQAAKKKIPQSWNYSRPPPVSGMLEDFPQLPRLEPPLQVTSQRAETEVIGGPSDEQSSRLKTNFALALST